MFHDINEMKARVRTFLEYNGRGKTAQTAKTLLSRLYYDGHHHWRYRRTLGMIYPDRELARITPLNYSQWVCQLGLSNVSNNYFVPEAFATTDRTESEQQAWLTTIIMRDLQRRNGGHARFNERDFQTFVDGDVMVRSEMDPFALDHVCLRPDELAIFERQIGRPAIAVYEAPENKKCALFRLGHLREVEIDASCFVTPANVSRFELVDEFAVVQYLPVDRVILLQSQLTEGEDVGIKAESIQDTSSVYPDSGSIVGGLGDNTDFDHQTARAFEETAGLVRLCEYWRRDLTSGDWYVFYLVGARSDTFIGIPRGGPLHEHPYTHFACWKQAQKGGIFSRTYISDLARLQVTLNKLAGEQLSHFRRSLKELIIAPEGAELKSISDKAYPILTYDHRKGEKVQVISVPSSTMQALQTFMNDYRQEFLRQGRVSDAMQGIMPNRTAQATYKEARKIDADGLADYVVRKKESYVTMWRKQVNIIARAPEFDVPRLATMLGDNASVIARVWRGAGLGISCNIGVKESMTQPETPEERFEYAKELAPLGFFNPGPEGEALRRNFAAFAQSGDLRTLSPKIDRLHQRVALEENHLLQYGRTFLQPIVGVDGPAGSEVPIKQHPVVMNSETLMPLIHETQNHEIHLEHHDEMIVALTPGSPEFEMAVAHRAEHTRILDEIQTRQMEDQLAQISRTHIAESSGQLVVTAAANAGKNNGARDPKIGGATAQEGGRRSGAARKT